MRDCLTIFGGFFNQFQVFWNENISIWKWLSLTKWINTVHKEFDYTDQNNAIDRQNLHKYKGTFNPEAHAINKHHPSYSFITVRWKASWHPWPHCSMTHEIFPGGSYCSTWITPHTVDYFKILSQKDEKVLFISEQYNKHVKEIKITRHIKHARQLSSKEFHNVKQQTFKMEILFLYC